MKASIRGLVATAPSIALFALLSWPTTSQAVVLVADRLSNSVYKYSNNGAFLGVVVTDNTNVNQPTGLALSPDRSHLYLSSSQNNRVVRYDFNVTTGTATNATIFAEGAADGLAFPNAVLFSQDGDTIYVSNLGGTGVAQFNVDGSSAGPPINGAIAAGSIFQYSGLAFAPTGELLVGGFQDFPAGANGAVARSNAAISSIADFIGPSPALNGASGLLISGNDLYVSALFAGNIQRYNATTGAVDPGFSLAGLAFPQALAAAPSGGGFLAGILGLVDGGGLIAHYDFNGNSVGDGVFAFASAGGGFREATAFAVTIPEPTSVVLLAAVLAPIGFVMRRRAAR
jgi:sugar lactone lactonase YvrE